MGFHGNQLNFLDTYYRIGYAIFLIPSQLVLTRIRASLWLPPLELAWGVMTGKSVAAELGGAYILTSRSHGRCPYCPRDVRVAFLHWRVRGVVISRHHQHSLQLVVRALLLFTESN